MDLRADITNSVWWLEISIEDKLGYNNLTV